MRRLLLIGSVLAMIGSASGTPNEPYCPFAYQRVMHELVLPELNAKLGKLASNFVADDPLLFQSREKLQIILSLGPSQGGGLPLDADDFVVTVDTCKFKVVESHFKSTMPNGRDD